MESSCAVDVIEQCRISPPSGSVSTTSLPITFFDIQWLDLPPFQRVFFYEFRHSKAYFTNTILPNIKHSLSFALKYFFPFSGYLTWSQDSAKPEILYTDGDSVLLTVAESDYDFYHLVGNHARLTSVFYPLVPQLLNTPGNKLSPVSAFQVTIFPNRGICFGITFSHVVADGRTIHHFVKSWASICRQEGDTCLMTDESLPCYDRSMVKDPNRIDMIYMNHLKNLNITRKTFNISRNHVVPTDKVLATFVMDPCKIKRLKQWVLTRLQDKSLHLSTFVLTCAYVWVCLINARWAEDVVNASEDETEYLLFSADCRARLDPSFPTTYFGNCIKPIMVKSTRSDLMGENGIPVAVELLGKAIQNIGAGEKILKDMESFFSSGFPWVPERIVPVAGSPKFGFYHESDFGWGIPKKVEILSIVRTGAISLSECASEIGAVEIGVVRNKVEMDAFTSLFGKTIEGFSKR